MVTAFRVFDMNMIAVLYVLDIITGNGFLDWDEFQQLMTRSWKSQKQCQLEMVAAFRVFDKNKDGYITVDELREALTTMGECMSPDEVDEIFQEADVNHDGKLSYKGIS